MKSDQGRGGLNAVVLLWPVAEDWPVGGEIDWMEIMDPPARRPTSTCTTARRTSRRTARSKDDATRWTAWALEWTPEKITGYVNGEEWYSTTDRPRRGR